MRWAGHVARMGGAEVYTGFWWGNLREKYLLREPGVDGRVILNGSLGSGVWGQGTDRAASG